MKIINRAKAIDGTGGYIISQSIKFENEKMFLYSIPFRQWVECDESTRSINFEDMLDSQGNKIFASLNEDGKGGDIVESYHYTDTNNKEHKLKHIAKWSNRYKGILFVNENSRNIDETGNGTGNVQMWTMKEHKVIGMQE